LSQSAVRALRDTIHATVITAADASYDSARSVWNGLVERRSGAIAYCTSIEDIGRPSSGGVSFGVLVSCS
jgi:hypothetical protein